MRLLSKKEAVSQSQDDGERLRLEAARLKEFVATEIKTYNVAKDTAAANITLMAEETNAFLEEKVAEKQAILAEIEALEARRQAALEPLLARGRAIQHAANGLDLRESRANLREHDLEIKERDLNDRLDAVMSLKDRLDDREDKLDVLESGLATKSDFIRRGSDLLDSRWKEYNERVVSEQKVLEEDQRLLRQENFALSVLKDSYNTLLKDLEKREEKLAFDREVFQREYNNFNKYGSSS